MSVSITELTPGFARQVSGIDITQPLTKEQVADLEAGMDRYAVLVYHDQPFTDDRQKAFSVNSAPWNRPREATLPKRPIAGWTPTWPTSPISVWIKSAGP